MLILVNELLPDMEQLVKETLYHIKPHPSSSSTPACRSSRRHKKGATLRHTVGPARLTANAYYSRFSNFIFQTPAARWRKTFPCSPTDAKVKDFGPAPQIPPLRILGGISGQRGPLEGRLEVEHAFRQSRNAPLETEADDYTLVNASLDWHPLPDHENLTLGIAANNIFNVVARRHSSLLKDFAPLAGRDIRLTASFGF